LPFDRSAADITAHAVAGVGVWLETLPAPLKQQASAGIRRMLDFLCRAQREEGSWVPLWFGNQSVPDKENPVYGTSRVLANLSRVPAACREGMDPACERAVRWLLSAQNADGGWGGASGVASSIEETALAVDALAGQPEAVDAACRGADWLITNTQQGVFLPVSPIGLYFAQLWYHEELYPLVFSLSALGRVQTLLHQRS
jgi:squalene-hopene/tetraprenyl-beta-curcumene cyclase